MKSRFARPLAALAVLLAVLGGAGAARADDADTLYHDHCRKCHGDDGRARTFKGYLYFARDLTDAAWQAKRSDDDIFRIISDSPGWYSTMPAFSKRLPEADRRALVQAVRRLGRTGQR